MKKKKSTSVKSLRYIDEFFSQLKISHYMKVASYKWLQSIKPATVVKQKHSSRGIL